jgi:hypothetical protein
VIRSSGIAQNQVFGSFKNNHDILLRRIREVSGAAGHIGWDARRLRPRKWRGRRRLRESEWRRGAAKN